MKISTEIDKPIGEIREVLEFAGKRLDTGGIFLRVPRDPCFSCSVQDFNSNLKANDGLPYRVVVWLNMRFGSGCIELNPSGRTMYLPWSEERLEMGYQPVLGWKDALVFLAAYGLKRADQMRSGERMIEVGANQEMAVGRAKAALRAYQTL